MPFRVYGHNFNFTASVPKSLPGERSAGRLVRAPHAGLSPRCSLIGFRVQGFEGLGVHHPWTRQSYRAEYTLMKAHIGDKAPFFETSLWLGMLWSLGVSGEIDENKQGGGGKRNTTNEGTSNQQKQKKQT